MPVGNNYRPLPGHAMPDICLGQPAFDLWNSVRHLRQQGRKDRFKGKRTVKFRVVIIFTDDITQIFETIECAHQLVFKMGQTISQLLHHANLVSGINENGALVS